MRDHTLEVQWVREAKAGREEAFERLVKTYYAPLFRLVFQMVPSAQDAEDILQESFYRFYRSLPRLRDGEDPFPFLRTIAVRRTYSFLRGRRPEALSLDDLPEDLPALSVEGHPMEVRTLYRWAATLPAQRRLVFIMRDVLGMEDAQIADILSVSEVTVRRHGALAREALEKLVGGR